MIQIVKFLIEPFDYCSVFVERLTFSFNSFVVFSVTLAVTIFEKSASGNSSLVCFESSLSVFSSVSS